MVNGFIHSKISFKLFYMYLEPYKLYDIIKVGEETVLEITVQKIMDITLKFIICGMVSILSYA